jgi:hypothetical protein
MSTATATEIRTYAITSTKRTTQIRGTLADAIHRAKAENGALQPAYGTDVECDGETVWSTEWPQFRYATDGDSGRIAAPDFDAACKQLDAMFTPEVIADGAWGWVQDADGHRHHVDFENMP